MFCTKCGTENDDNAFKCVKCGTILQHPQQPGTGTSAVMRVPNYLVQAILLTVFTTLFCFVPALAFAIVALVFAVQVNSKLQRGDYNGAVEASKNAKRWCWVSFWVGIALVIISVIYIIVILIIESSGY